MSCLRAKNFNLTPTRAYGPNSHAWMKNVSYNSLNWNTFLIWEMKTLCNWKSKWVLDGTYPKSQISMISDKKSIGNEVVFSETLPQTGSERCTRLSPVPLLYAKWGIESFSLELQNWNVFRHLRKSSGKLWMCFCRLRKSWYSPVKNLTPLTQKKLAGIVFY